MPLEDTVGDPDLDTPLSLTLSPAMLFHALMGSASAVHTGWQSCIDNALVVSELIATDDRVGNYCRLVEQEFVEDEQPDTVWHDWTLEIRIDPVLITGHWQLPATAHPSEWEWNAREARRAFERACVLFGRRTRPGVVIDEPAPAAPSVPRASRH
ncbi:MULTISPECIES: hypothetical protein [Marichromatium]|uniref:Uncharacterized protein n=1 Tax=Marichromatium gracile TaxID=1048 RepID=A0A4R4AAC0_MARGR|nr:MULTISPECIES: hypothetical protein [Marichromatium]MBO8084936.1 hypothetical protein [Marichromatium sp.]MBK1708859.1 hypothetical protein [Marichromatium gracile]RNE90370.1 hypothetical protein EBL84_07235 [Marichromatium sp. AB31]RNE94623.1 hypothetical protein EBL85_00305 [Marichromatium sp. AB32]TCW35921.1 hypothetical protein EDC29_10595 [Marichromatium gracile]